MAQSIKISDADMEALKEKSGDTDYGAASVFPVFGKKRRVENAARED